MIPSRFVCLLGIGIILTGSVRAAPAPKSNQTMILGVWEVIKSDDGTPPMTTIEFTRDGKLKVKTKVGDQTLTMEGTYKLEGDKLTVTLMTPDEKEKEVTDTVTITKLTDKDLITKDQKGKVDQFKKKK
jgi:uncharacterized protein (TIGR03066 family)